MKRPFYFPMSSSTSPSTPVARAMSACLWIALMTVLFVPVTAFADGESLGFFESRRVAKEADQAMAAGRYSDALKLYERLADGTEVTNKRHAHGLRQAAAAALLAEPSDGERAAGHLDRLPKAYARGPEIALLRRLAAAGEAPVAAAAESEPCPVPDEPAAGEAPAGELEGQLKARLKRLEKELAATTAELKRKDEALEKLKAMVVGDS